MVLKSHYLWFNIHLIITCALRQTLVETLFHLLQDNASAGATLLKTYSEEYFGSFIAEYWNLQDNTLK